MDSLTDIQTSSCQGTEFLSTLNSFIVFTLTFHLNTTDLMSNDDVVLVKGLYNFHCIINLLIINFRDQPRN